MCEPACVPKGSNAELSSVIVVCLRRLGGAVAPCWVCRTSTSREANALQLQDLSCKVNPPSMRASMTTCPRTCRIKAISLFSQQLMTLEEQAWHASEELFPLVGQLFALEEQGLPLLLNLPVAEQGGLPVRDRRRRAGGGR